MLTIIDNLNKSNTLTPDCRLVSFDIINMFPSIDNISGLKAVKSILDAKQDQFPPTTCIIEALKLCLECNNSIFNNKHFLQSDGTAQGPHMSCSYSDIAIQYFDVKALEYTPATICWKRFRDDIFIVWPHSIDELDIFFDYMNKVDPTKKIQFTMEVATDTLEFLDLKLKFDKESKQISVDVFAKDTDSFTYVLPSTCFPKNNIENIPKGVALRLRRICDSDEKFEKHSAEYQNYLIARDYKPGKVKKQFSDIKKLTRKEARKPKLLKTTFSTSFNLITQCDLLFPNLKTLIRNHLSILYKRNKNLRKILSPSLFLRTTKHNEYSIKECNRKCDI